MMLLLDILYFVFLLLLSPWLLARMLIHGRYRRGWKDRLGFVPRRYTRQPCVWIHAVSLGEINAAATLIKAVEKKLPQCEIVISTTTDTGFNRANTLYSRSHRVFFFPWDFSCCIRRALDRLHPQLCVMMELEVWHNFTALAAKKSIPVVVANGRISSAKGFPRYKKIAWLIRPMFRRLSLVLAQSALYADRFADLGVPRDRVKVVGSLKYDTAQTADRIDGADALAAQLHRTPDQKVFVAGSTGPGEESMILNALDQIKNQLPASLRVVIVPRKPERFDEVAGLIESRGLGLIRYSAIKSAPQSAETLDHNAIILGDTMGDLRKFYSLADVIFVGRSLVPMGGSDMIEAAALAKPVIVGPYTDNFADAVESLLNAQAIKIVQNQDELSQAVTKLLQNAQYAADMGRLARQAVIDQQGATQKTIEQIARVLGCTLYPRATSPIK